MGENSDSHPPIGALRYLPKDVPAVRAAIDGLRDIAARHAPLLREGGLGCFDYLCHEITREARDRIHHGESVDTEFVIRLDLEFAVRYFDAVFADAAGTPLPNSWRVLLVRRPALDVDTRQFAAGGRNAHLSPDLAIALLSMRRVTERPYGEAEYADYQAINRVFADHIGQLREHCERRLRRPLGIGVFALVANAVGDLTLVFARDAAWHQAQCLATLLGTSSELDRARVSIDWQVAMVGRTVLDLPVL
jgi:Family of unknown function (DUF5995)